MNKITSIFIVLSTILSVNAFSQFHISAGTNYGGALPTKMTEGSSAVIFPGAYLNLERKIKISENLSLIPSASVDFRMFNYYASEKKDTIVSAEVMGIIANVPTYYNADISGKVRLLAAFIQLPIQYNFSRKSSLIFGIYGSALAHKSDEININVRIGEGGLLPDIDSSYNNRQNINNYDAGLQLGGRLNFENNFSLEIIAFR